MEKTVGKMAMNYVPTVKYDEGTEGTEDTGEEPKSMQVPRPSSGNQQTIIVSGCESVNLTINAVGNNF